MLYRYFVINNIYFLLVKDTLLEMTVNNPIFIFAVITVIWCIPGILVRRFNEQRMVKKKERNQSEAIKKLYPKAKDFPD